MQISSNETRWLLTQWARWAMVNPGISLNYPSKEVCARLIAEPGKTVIIDDQKAMEIDKYVSKLTSRRYEMGEALTTYYFSGENLTYTAKQLKINRKKADVIVGASIAWVDSVIENQKN